MGGDDSAGRDTGTREGEGGAVEQVWTVEEAAAEPSDTECVQGVSSLEGEEWAKRRRIIAPAFHLEKLKIHSAAKNKRRSIVDTEIKSIFRAMIEEKLRSVESDNSDILGSLLHLAKDSKNNMTIDDIIEECKLFYFAGKETTSTWLTWTVILLSMHPTWQQRARDEVLRTCKGNMPNFESISQLKTVTMILYEVLRLYPSVVALVAHTYGETKIGDLSIPEGVGILMPAILIHHDEDYWGGDAEEFNPERFSEGVAKASKNAYYPFGWGPRVCLGQNFAMIEAKMAVAMILQRFSLELSPAYAHAPYIATTLQPQHGAHVVLRRRRDSVM